MDVGYSLTGFDELHKALGTFGEKVERQLVLTGLRAGGRVVIKHAADMAPVDDGILADKKSWTSKPGRFQEGKEISLQVGTKAGRKFAWYAHLVEFGTATARAQPFFRPAFDEHPEDIIGAVAASMARAIPRAVARGRR